MGINAEIIADSVCNNHRITSFLLTIPQIVVKELLRHRMFSFSSSSMRAIPFDRVLKMLEDNTFIPIGWLKEHKKMQGFDYISDDVVTSLIEKWINYRDYAIDHACELEKEYNVTKQLSSRLIEPFGYAKILVTATEYTNFFNLRCPKYVVSWYPENNPEALEPTESTFNSKKDAINRTEGECDNYDRNMWRSCNISQAEIHIQSLSEIMWDLMKENKPKTLYPGEWHIPFGDRINNDELYNKFILPYNFDYCQGRIDLIKLQIATSRCARLSYMNHDGKIDYEKDIELHDNLFDNSHLSPFEHCAKAMNDNEYNKFISYSNGSFDKNGNLIEGSEKGWCKNFKGWISYRFIRENERY